MTYALPTTPAPRLRRRSVWATLALVGALVATGAAAPASADVFTDGPGTLSGTVTTPDGQPVANASVYALIETGGEGTPWGAGVSTDASGHYELVGIPLGYYGVQATNAGYDPSGYQFTTLTDASLSGVVNFVIHPFAVGVGTIAGHVTGDGVPLANVQMWASNQSTFQNFSATTNAAGFYEFTGLSNGTWLVGAFVGSEYQYPQSQAASISDQSPNATLNFALESWPVGTASISGTVTNAETNEPISGLWISLYGIDVAHNTNIPVDDAGAYSFGDLPEGTYQISLWSFGYLSVQKQVSVLEGGHAVVDFALIPADSTISGHVVGPDGQPAVDTYVSAYSASTGSGGGTATDANGDYMLVDLGPVEYTVTVGGVGTAYESQDKVVTAVAHGDVTANFTTTPRTTGYFTGTVLDEDGQWVNEPVCATLYSSKSKKPLTKVATFGDNFGDGTWAFDKVKPGSYTVEFRDCDDDPATKFDKVFLGGVKTYKDATFVTIVAGQDSFNNSVTLTRR